MLYHANVSWARGGFFGVDIFFVLSGFLITALLLVERETTGRVNLVAFWSRRALRLLPALLVLLVAVACYALVLAQPTELNRIRSDGLASLFYVSNWKLILDGSSYFQAFQTPSPLAHTWSLAIEEQWYLVWPFALALLTKCCRRDPRLLAVVIGALACSSPLRMAFLFYAGADPSRVYYGTDTRVQALLVGAFLAVLSAGGRRVVDLDRWRRSLQFFGLVALVLVAIMVVRVDARGAFLYRGGFLAVAVAAAVLVAAAAQDGPFASVLSAAPLRMLGKISYGVYLWHWFVDVVVDESRTHLAGFELFAVRVALTLAIATVSYVCIERPLRQRARPSVRASSPRRALRVVMPASAAAVGVLIVAVTTGGVAVPSVGALQQRGLDALTARAGAASVPRILMLGDSQLLTYAFYTGMTYLHSTNPRYEFDPIIGCGVVGGGVQAERACDHRAAMWQRDVTELDPDLSVLMIGAWETLDFDVAGHTNVHATPEHERALASVLSSAIRPLLARGGHVALLEVPCYGHSTDDLPNHDQRTAPAAVSNVNDALRQVARRSPSSVTFVPWADAICPGGHFSPDVHGTRVRPDGVHYASAAASQLVSDAIMPTLQRLAVATHAQRAMARH